MDEMIADEVMSFTVDGFAQYIKQKISHEWLSLIHI